MNGIRMENKKDYLQIGSMLGDGRYRIEEICSYDDVMVTYKAYDTFRKKELILRELFCVSLLQRDADGIISCKKLSDEQLFLKMKEKLILKAKKYIRLYPISGIRNVLNYLEENNTVYILEENVEGITLEEFFQKRHSVKFTVESIMESLSPVMDTLTTLHQRGMVHGLISPEKILVTKDSKYILTDVVNLAECLTSEKLSMVAARRDGYAPVELYLDKTSLSPQTDLFEVGAIFYRYVTGQALPPYFERINDNTVTALPSQCEAPVMELQSRAIMKSVAVYAFDRYENFEEMKNELCPPDLALDDMQKETENPRTFKKAPFWYAHKKKEKRRYGIVVAVILIVGMIILIPALWQVGHTEMTGRFYGSFVKKELYDQCVCLTNMNEKQRKKYTNDYMDIEEGLTDEEQSDKMTIRYYDYQLKKLVDYKSVNVNRPVYEYLKIDYRKDQIIMTYMSNEKTQQSIIEPVKTKDGKYKVSVMTMENGKDPKADIIYAHK